MSVNSKIYVTDDNGYEYLVKVTGKVTYDMDEGYGVDHDDIGVWDFRCINEDEEYIEPKEREILTLVRKNIYDLIWT